MAYIADIPKNPPSNKHKEVSLKQRERERERERRETPEDTGNAKVNRTLSLRAERSNPIILNRETLARLLCRFSLLAMTAPSALKRSCCTCCILILFFLLFSPSLTAAADKPTLRIGYIPILDHLTLPIAYELSNKGEFKNFNLEPVKYTSWKSIEDALTAGGVDGAFLLVPLGMHLRQDVIPLKLVILGHRNGSALTVKPEVKTIEEAKGGILAIPYIFSMHNINLYKYVVEQNQLKMEDFVTLVMAPPDMAPSLARGEIDGFIVALPYPTLAEMTNIGRILAYTFEIWKDHPDCALYVPELLLNAHTDAVSELAGALVKAAKFIESNPEKAAEMGAPYIGLNKEILYKGLTDPPEGIIYTDLIPRKEEFEEIQSYLLRMGLFKEKMNLDELLDDRFVISAYK